MASELYNPIAKSNPTYSLLAVGLKSTVQDCSRFRACVTVFRPCYPPDLSIGSHSFILHECVRHGVLGQAEQRLRVCVARLVHFAFLARRGHVAQSERSSQHDDGRCRTSILRLTALEYLLELNDRVQIDPCACFGPVHNLRNAGRVIVCNNGAMRPKHSLKLCHVRDRRRWHILS